MLMRVLAIDHGLARAGVAISDPSETIASPVGVVEPPEAAAVAKLAGEREADLVVVGLPVSLDGAEREQARSARDFAAELAELLEIPVQTWDERLTTRMADATRRSGAGAAPDALAAAHLLASFLQRREAERSEAR